MAHFNSHCVRIARSTMLKGPTYKTLSFPGQCQEATARFSPANLWLVFAARCGPRVYRTLCNISNRILRQPADVKIASHAPPNPGAGGAHSLLDQRFRICPDSRDANRPSSNLSDSWAALSRRDVHVDSGNTSETQLRGRVQDRAFEFGASLLALAFVA